MWTNLRRKKLDRKKKTMLLASFYFFLVPAEDVLKQMTNPRKSFSSRKMIGGQKQHQPAEVEALLCPPSHDHPITGDCLLFLLPDDLLNLKFPLFFFLQKNYTHHRCASDMQAFQIIPPKRQEERKSTSSAHNRPV